MTMPIRLGKRISEIYSQSCSNIMLSQSTPLFRRKASVIMTTTCSSGNDYQTVSILTPEAVLLAPVIQRSNQHKQRAAHVHLA